MSDGDGTEDGAGGDGRRGTEDGAARDGNRDDEDVGLAENVGRRFDRLPATEADREVAGRPTRAAVLSFWEDRFGVPPAVFEGYSFWEKGAGKLWVLHGDLPSPVVVQALGMTFLRVRQEHWKPTTDAVQRFGGHATRNVVDLAPAQARRFVAGEDQSLAWDGDWGYLVAAHEVAGERAPIGVGLYVHGELRSMIPKGRRRSLPEGRRG